MQNLIKIGRDIIIGTGLAAKHWAGSVVFGRDAIYVLPSASRISIMAGSDSAAAGAGALLGIVGHVLAAGLPKGSQHWKACALDLQDLPREVTGDPGWPATGLWRTVIVLERAHVSGIERKGGKVVVEAFGERFKFGLKLFGRGRIIRGVQDLGWRI
jgi:hypothetical protein